MGKPIRGVFGGGPDRWRHSVRQYDIYVPVEQEHKALEALGGRRGG
ncbi:hypothetical protein [Alicyclobacillus sp.]|nr:hypothetical protein [Alicyclobacillus sp.]MCL6516103.1 hypothetical protein [Alicyclobacillus sp.]